jgi:hypothetical protein
VVCLQSQAPHLIRYLQSINCCLFHVYVYIHNNVLNVVFLLMGGASARAGAAADPLPAEHELLSVSCLCLYSQQRA